MLGLGRQPPSDPVRVGLGVLPRHLGDRVMRTDHGPTNLAALRTLAINALRLAGHPNIAAGLRQHTRTPQLPLATLGLT